MSLSNQSIAVTGFLNQTAPGLSPKRGLFGSDPINLFLVEGYFEQSTALTQWALRTALSRTQQLAARCMQTTAYYRYFYHAANWKESWYTLAETHVFTVQA